MSDIFKREKDWAHNSSLISIRHSDVTTLTIPGSVSIVHFHRIAGPSDGDSRLLPSSLSLSLSLSLSVCLCHCAHVCACASACYHVSSQIWENLTSATGVTSRLITWRGRRPVTHEHARHHHDTATCWSWRSSNCTDEALADKSLDNPRDRIYATSHNGSHSCRRKPKWAPRPERQKLCPQFSDDFLVYLCLT